MRKSLAIAAVALVLAGCGQTDPPTVDELTEGLKYFQVTRPDGTTMWCNYYATESEFSNDSKSWFGYTCDWSGQYPGAK